MQLKTTNTRWAEREHRAKQNQTPIANTASRWLAAITVATIGIAPLSAETFTLQEATIEQIQKAMAAGALSSVELNTLYLNRVAIYDRNGIKLNSVVEVNPSVLAEAAAADTLRAQGTVRGPLHGVTVLPKMNHAVARMHLSGDSPEFSNTLASKDAENVTRIKAGGGVILGLANMDSYYLDDLYSDPPTPTVTGPAKHAYRADLLPGDSSTGSGTALASNFAVLSLGGDTGTSNRCNSGVSELATGRITAGLLSNRGTAPIKAPRDQPAPMARTIRDLALAFDAVVGDDPLDGTRFFRLPDHRFPTQSYTSKLDVNALRGVRLGYTQTVVNGASPETRALFLQAIEDLRRLGATVVRVEPYPNAGLSRNTAFARDLSSTYGADYTALSLENASRFWAFRSFFEEYMNPVPARATFLTAFEWTAEDIAEFDPFANEPPSNSVAASNFVSARADARQSFETWLTQNDLAAIIYPVDPWGAEPATAPFSFSNEFSDGAFEYAASDTVLPGLPAIDVFGGVSPDGIPNLGVEFRGRAFDELNLFAYAYAYEQGTKFRASSALTPPLPGETIEYSTALPPPSRPELNAPALRVAAGAKVAGKGKKATLVLTGGAVDASGLAALTVYVNGKKIAAKKAKNWKATIRLAALRSFVKGSVKTVQVTVVAKDVYGNTSVTTKTVKLPKTA